MEKVAKYNLKLKSKDNKYTVCYIEGLQNAYYKDYQNNLESFGGGCGLIKCELYEGYCILCMTYHSFNEDKVGNINLPEPTYVVEFSPLYNKNGDMILIKYDKDEVFCSIDGGGYQENWDSDKLVDASLTFWNNGTFKEFY